MSRKKKDHTRVVEVDGKYGDLTISRFVNIVMKSGKKGVAERNVYLGIEAAAAKLSEEPVKVFLKAVANVKPIVEVRSRRVGGANYQVPTEVNAKRGQSLALRWIIGAANERTERTLAERIGNELVDAINERGGAVKKRDDTHRMADANKAFAHFKW